MSRPSTKASIKSIFPTGLHDVTHRHDVQCSISLAEPCVFLTGFDFDGGGSNSPSPAAGLAVLRGTLQIRIVNSARVRAITLKLTPSGQINWPVGVTGALRSEFLGGDKFASQTLTLFNAVHDTLQTEYGNQVRYDLEETFEAQETINMRHSACNNSTRQLSLQIELHKPSNWNRNRGNSFSESKNAKVFPPGTYTYFFELPIGNSSIETVRVKYAWVKWNLEATVQRPGIFAPRVVCSTEVSVIRIPDPMSLRISEPIYMSRSLGDQIRVDCSISGKSFAIGSKIPISIRLTPLTKTRIEKVQVYVTEAVQYWVENKAEIRHDPTRKLLLYEKKPGRAAYTVGSSPSPSRTRRGQVTGVARKARASLPLEPTSPTPPIQNAIPNVPGDIDLGLENLCGPAELQYEIQIPTCSMMETNRALRLRPDCSWNRVDINHWIEIVIGVTSLDEHAILGGNGTSMTISSQISLLNCLASHSNLPIYDGSYTRRPGPLRLGCGCPSSAEMDSALSRPTGASIQARPFNSFREAIFSSVLSPPPSYDAEKDGLTDYFRRLACHDGCSAQQPQHALDG